jgi:hypothetical protein
MDVHAPTAGHGGRIFIFGFLSAIAPLSIDLYLPALPMLRQALAADEAQTLFTLSAFFIGFAGDQHPLCFLIPWTAARRCHLFLERCFRYR